MTTKPRTAYELLERVCEHILEEPKRYDQSEWAVVGSVDIWNRCGWAPPACGTVACRAGWIVGLHDGLDALKPLMNSLIKSIPQRANAILAMTHDDTDELFDGFVNLCENADAGTPEYAQLGVDGLRAFMQKHEAHLKARVLEGV